MREVALGQKDLRDPGSFSCDSLSARYYVVSRLRKSLTLGLFFVVEAAMNDFDRVVSKNDKKTRKFNSRNTPPSFRGNSRPGSQNIQTEPSLR